MCLTAVALAEEADTPKLIYESIYSVGPNGSNIICNDGVSVDLATLSPNAFVHNAYFFQRTDGKSYFGVDYQLKERYLSWRCNAHVVLGRRPVASLPYDSFEPDLQNRVHISFDERRNVISCFSPEERVNKLQSVTATPFKGALCVVYDSWNGGGSRIRTFALQDAKIIADVVLRDVMLNVRSMAWINERLVECHERTAHNVRISIINVQTGKRLAVAENEAVRIAGNRVLAQKIIFTQPEDVPKPRNLFTLGEEK